MKTPQATIDIGGRLVGDGAPCFVIAEAGVNHNGSLELAIELVDRAAQAGADAVKFQTFKTDKLVTADAPQAAYQQRNTGQIESQREMLARLELDRDAHVALIERCRQRDIQFLSSPFDESSADLLAELACPALKLGSGELTNLPLLEHVARLGVPMIVSTGMGTLGEVDDAVHAIRDAGGEELCLLHCVSNYPADPAEVNLRAMQTMRDAFGVPVGYSDHTLGEGVSLAATALGACVLEKHFTLDRSLPGPDHAASLEPDELAKLIEGVRTVAASLGDGRKAPAASELDTARVARKSLVAAESIAAGTVLTENLIAIKRPGSGLRPALRPQLLNRRVATDLPAGHVFEWRDVA